MEILKLFHKNTLFSLSQCSGYCACVPCAFCRFVGVLLEKCDFLYFQFSMDKQKMFALIRSLIFKQAPRADRKAKS